MTDLSGPGPAEPKSGSRQRPDRSAAAVPAAREQVAARSEPGRPDDARSEPGRSDDARSQAARSGTKRPGCGPPGATRPAGDRPADRPAGDRAAGDCPAGERPVDRRQQRRWVPVAASWLMRLVGLADIVLGLTAPGSHLHNRL